MGKYNVPEINQEPIELLYADPRTTCFLTVGYAGKNGNRVIVHTKWELSSFSDDDIVVDSAKSYILPIKKSADRYLDIIMPDVYNAIENYGYLCFRKYKDTVKRNYMSATDKDGRSIIFSTIGRRLQNNRRVFAFRIDEGMIDREEFIRDATEIATAKRDKRISKKSLRLRIYTSGEKSDLICDVADAKIIGSRAYLYPIYKRKIENNVF